MNKNDLDLCKRALYDVKMAEDARFEKLSENIPEHSAEFNEKMSAKKNLRLHVVT